MKAVLVIDRFPESCADCDFITDEDGTIVFKCSLNGMNVLTTLNERLNNCPLKELPDHITFDDMNKNPALKLNEGYVYGWNQALDVIERTED